MGRIFKNILKIAVGIYVFFFAYEWWHPMPDSLRTPPRVVQVPDAGIHFFADTSYIDAKKNVRVLDEHIWNQVGKIVGSAKHSITLDMFLYNDFQGSSPETARKLSAELTDMLVNKKIAEKHIAIALITDPINTVYGGVVSPYFTKLMSSGIPIITTDLTFLPDSNVPWSAAWHPFMSWMGNSTTGGWIAHPFDATGGKVTLRSWMALLNMKANHRKLLVADQPIVSGKNAGKQKMVTFVTSSNPHDGSSANGNVAIEVDDKIWRDAITSENIVAQLSGVGLPNYDPPDTVDMDGGVSVSLLHEAFIRDKVLERIEKAKQGEQISMVMFYLSERDVIKALIDASNRGVNVRIILDPNNDAFGFKKNGIPNQPVAKELMQRSNNSIQVRWCATTGEQCHAKLMFGSSATSSYMFVGSANFTRRNLDGFNLETDIYAENAGPHFSAWNDASTYFEKMWANTGGRYTDDYSLHQDDTFWKLSLARLMEWSGMSSF